jgi:CheY-like chemotaxis protein
MPAPDDALRDLRILLVEDDPLIRLDLESSLAELGASVTAAAYVSRALAALDASAFDFALLDWNSALEPANRSRRRPGRATFHYLSLRAQRR